MQKETLKAFLQDETFRAELKAMYQLDDQDIDDITMTTSENIIEVIIIKEIINKHTGRVTTNIAAAQLNNLLDSRL